MGGGGGGCIWGGVGSAVGGGEGTVQPCLGRCGCVGGCGWWAVSAVLARCGGCGWWAVSVVSEGGERRGLGAGGACQKRALSSGGKEGMWAVGGYGGGGVVGGVGGDYKPLDSLCFGGEEGMWAMGAVGVLEESKACGRWVWWECCCGW